MKQLLLIGYEFLTAMVPAVVLTAVFYFHYKRRGVPMDRQGAVYRIIFSLYLFGVFYCTGAGTFFDIKRRGLELATARINLIPFSDADIDLTAYVLNVVLFLPFGFLLPMLWRHFEKYRYAGIAGFAFSALIEASQLLNSRATDIDDLILNTAGALLGTALFKLFSHFRRRGAETKRDEKYEVYVYIIFMFLCRFFLFDELGMAKKLYGF